MFEIHPDWIVQNVVLRGTDFLLFGLFLARLEGFNFVVVENVNFEVLQYGNNVFDFIRVVDGIGQGLVDVLIGEEALFFRKAYQIPNALVKLFLRFWRELSLLNRFLGSRCELGVTCVIAGVDGLGASCFNRSLSSFLFW